MLTKVWDFSLREWTQNLNAPFRQLQSLRFWAEVSIGCRLILSVQYHFVCVNERQDSVCLFRSNNAYCWLVRQVLRDSWLVLTKQKSTMSIFLCRSQLKLWVRRICYEPCLLLMGRKELNGCYFVLILGYHMSVASVNTKCVWQCCCNRVLIGCLQEVLNGADLVWLTM